MSFNQDMYNELYKLRQDLKDEGKLKQGRAPLVCTDEALNEIVMLCPKKISDFYGVSGIGKSFIDNYGEEFLRIILKYAQTTAEKKISMNTVVSDTLKELEKKLVSINKRNRLLYMPKLASKHSFDLYDVGLERIERLLYGIGQTITICDTELYGIGMSPTEEVKYKKIVQLLREVNKDIRDKGKNELYIAYPFVIGRLKGENFNVRAPLVLFPVVAERTTTNITLTLDDSRDVIYNTTLILANYKFSGINRPLPISELEDYGKDSLINSAIDYYNASELYIQDINKEFSCFHEYKADEFPEYNSGELYVEASAVLGKFPICHSSIQKDFEEIIENNEINILLNDLLLSAEEIDYYSDDYTGEEQIKIDDKELVVSEHDMVYINDLNSAQETVMSAIDELDELVIQGPPGTGKSQTITSLISKMVSEGKNVLLVSEKKTALDVVYSRLGRLSQYALMIDDVSNKEAFYTQLSKMIALGKDTTYVEGDIEKISENIDVAVDKLEDIARALYMPGEIGIEPYKLYLRSKKIDLSDEHIKSRTFALNSNRSEKLLDYDFDTLEAMYKKFNNENLTDKLETYVHIETTYTWMKYILASMTEYDVMTMQARIKELKESVVEWQSKNFIVKIFTKSKVLNTIGDFASAYLSGMDKEFKKTVLKNTSILDSLSEGIANYVIYQELKPLYSTLSEDEIEYFMSLINIKKVIGTTLNLLNGELFNEILGEHIAKFELTNCMELQHIESFTDIIKELSQCINKKQELSRSRIEAILTDSMYDIISSKRHGEILRVLDSKRKWSVNRFIKKFDFEIFKSVKIWLLTPEVVSEIIPLQTGIFDLVIFDEASQMYVEKGIPSILRAKKVIIAGDHKQLRPSNLGAGRLEVDMEELPEDEEISAALEEESLLDLARFKYQDVMLNFHYRAKYEELIAFSNYAFYRGRLYVSPNTSELIAPPIEFHKMENAKWQNRSNIVEAQHIVRLLKDVFESRKHGETIGIITFNTSQRDMIEDMIDDECVKDPIFAACIRAEMDRKEDGQDIGLFVKNIESVQGDERDIIIFSIGYAKNENGRLVRNFGWLNQQGGENRLNVAISRAKRKVYVVASFHPDELQVEDMKNQGPKILKKYLQYAYAVSNKDTEGAQSILHSFGDTINSTDNIHFDSDFENQVYDALVSRGYTVDTQVGIGGYSIDLAIKNDDKYILGIECDGRLYHSSKSARERDYHRQKYLEGRGWNIHRIWSPNWWKNSAMEIERICNLVESLKGSI